MIYESVIKAVNNQRLKDLLNSKVAKVIKSNPGVAIASVCGLSLWLASRSLGSKKQNQNY